MKAKLDRHAADLVEDPAEHRAGNVEFAQTFAKSQAVHEPSGKSLTQTAQTSKPRWLVAMNRRQKGLLPPPLPKGRGRIIARFRCSPYRGLLSNWVK